MGALLLTVLLGVSVLVIARFSPRTRNDTPDEVVAEQNPVSGTTEMGAPGTSRFPYLTVAVVLLVTWAVLTLATTSPLILVAVLFALTVGVYATYRVRHRSMDNRELVGRSLSDLRHLAVRVRNDFWTSFVRLRGWWQRRLAEYREYSARMEREKAAELERQARERARLEQMERERRARPYNDHLTIGAYEDIQRKLQREQQRHAEQMEQKRIQREWTKDFVERQTRRYR